MIFINLLSSLTEVVNLIILPYLIVGPCKRIVKGLINAISASVVINNIFKVHAYC